MFGKGVGIGRLAGIPISIHPFWLITWSLGGAYYPTEEVPGIATAAAYGLGLASALTLFGGASFCTSWGTRSSPAVTA